MAKRSNTRKQPPASGVVERFAPSPNGRLHLGHAFSAMLAHDAARAADGRFLLRMEDLDTGRARPEHVTAIEEDLAWLGVEWETPVLHQSTRLDVYADALATLDARGLTYPCFCTRRDIAEALDAPQERPAIEGPDGLVYPGLCRDLSPQERAARLAAGTSHAIRLDMRKAIAALGGRGIVSKLSFKEIGAGPAGETGRIDLDPAAMVETVGDVALGRKEMAASYHLAVVIDDAFQGITHVTRGEDLFEAAKLQRLLQALFGRPTPSYRHHRLIRDAEGRRLAKRDRDAGIAELRAEGVTPEEIRFRVGLPPAAGA